MAGPAKVDAGLAAEPLRALGRDRCAAADLTTGEGREEGEEGLKVAGKTEWTNPMATNLGERGGLDQSPASLSRRVQGETHPRM